MSAGSFKLHQGLLFIHEEGFLSVCVDHCQQVSLERLFDPRRYRAACVQSQWQVSQRPSDPSPVLEPAGRQ